MPSYNYEPGKVYKEDHFDFLRKKPRPNGVVAFYTTKHEIVCQKVDGGFKVLSIRHVQLNIPYTTLNVVVEDLK